MNLSQEESKSSKDGEKNEEGNPKNITYI